MTKPRGTYAQTTTVSPERSRGELEQTLRRYGATAFAYAVEPMRAVVAFDIGGRRVRLVINFPKPEDFRLTAQSRVRSDAQMAAAHEQAIRQRWRALLLMTKAKLEAVESGVANFDEEWLAYLLLPDGTTVAERLTPQMDAIQRDGIMPSLLQLGRGGE